MVIKANPTDIAKNHSTPPLHGDSHYLYLQQHLSSARFPMVCRNICLRYPRIQVGDLAGGKYCRRCEYYFFTERLFCECCGMRLRASPAKGEPKEKVRAKKRELIDNVLIRK